MMGGVQIGAVDAQVVDSVMGRSGAKYCDRYGDPDWYGDCSGGYNYTWCSGKCAGRVVQWAMANLVRQFEHEEWVRLEQVRKVVNFKEDNRWIEILKDISIWKLNRIYRYLQ